MTKDSMLFWLKNIIAPYVKEKREELNGNYRCVIICDSCSAHFSEDITQILSEIGNISFLPIPAHSSHLTQMLDATVFGALKRRYKSTPCDKKITSQFTQKLIRMKIAYQQTMLQELIKSGWEATGFILTLENGCVTNVSFNDEFKNKLREECQNVSNQS